MKSNLSLDLGNIKSKAQNKEASRKGHSFDVRRSRRHIPTYTRERAAAMFLGSIVREFY